MTDLILLKQRALEATLDPLPDGPADPERVSEYAARYRKLPQAQQAFRDAVTPAVVLSLLADMEALKGERDEWRSAALDVGVIDPRSGTITYGATRSGATSGERDAASVVYDRLLSRAQAAEARATALEAERDEARVLLATRWEQILRAVRAFGNEPTDDPYEDVVILAEGSSRSQPSGVGPSDLTAGLGAETSAAVKRTMTLTLTDAEMAALEKLIAERDLQPPSIFRQALKVYQLDGSSVAWLGYREDQVREWLADRSKRYTGPDNPYGRALSNLTASTAGGGWKPDREAVARIIAPNIFWQFENTQTGARIYAEHMAEALKTADAILALPQHRTSSDGAS